MQNSAWKLTALAGVIGLGFLVVAQTQFGLMRPADDTVSQPQSPQKNTSVANPLKSPSLPSALAQTEPKPKNVLPIGYVTGEKEATAKKVILKTESLFPSGESASSELEDPFSKKPLHGADFPVTRTGAEAEQVEKTSPQPFPVKSPPETVEKHLDDEHNPFDPTAGSGSDSKPKPKTIAETETTGTAKIAPTTTTTVLPKAPVPPAVTSKPKPFHVSGDPTKLQTKSETVKTAGSPLLAPAKKVQRAHLTIGKTAPQNANLGKPFVYDIVVKNTGQGTAYNVVVKDEVPEGTKLAGTAPQAILSGKATLRWKLGEIPAGEQRKISVKVIPVKAGQIGSVATVNFVSEVETPTVATVPKIELRVLAPKQVPLGKNAKFRFTITNKGKTPVHNVWVRDIIPNGLQHSTGNDLKHKLGTIKPGEGKIVNLALSTTKSGQVVNRVVVVADGGLRIESQDIIEIIAAKLVITRTGPKLRYVGRHAIYTNIVTNDSTQSLKGAELTEQIPAGMDFVEATAGGKYNAITRMVAWRVNGLKPRESQAFQIKLLPKKIGEHRSVVQAKLDDGSIVQANSKTTIEGFSAITLNANSFIRPIELGEQATLRIVAKNRGTANASTVKVQLNLPKQLQFVGLRGNVKYNANGQTVTLKPLATLKPGEEIVFELIVKPTAAGDVRVGLQIQSQEMQLPLNREEAIRIIAPIR